MNTIKPKLNIKSADLNFIYSFIPVYEDDKMSPDMDELLKMFNGNKGRPAERRGFLSTYQALDLNIGYEELPKIECEIGQFKVKVKPLLRFFPTGCSCCLTVSINPEENGEGIYETDIYELIHLVGMIENKKARNCLTVTSEANAFNFKKGKKYTIYQIFKKIIDHKEEQWKELKLKNKKGKSRSLKILNNEYLLQNEIEEPHYPWLLTSLELYKGGALSAFCGSFPELNGEIACHAKRDLLKKYESAIAPIVFRVAGKSFYDWQTEPSYIYSSDISNTGFYNMFLHSKFYVHTSRRSMLTVTGDKTVQPASYAIPTLLDICEMTHTRWQNLIILNMSLDKKIRSFSYNYIDPDEKLDSLISLINISSRCLEDPALYTVSGNALREIRESLVDTFQLDGLAKLVLQKIELLEKVHRRTSEKTLFDKYMK